MQKDPPWIGLFFKSSFWIKVALTRTLWRHWTQSIIEMMGKQGHHWINFLLLRDQRCWISFAKMTLVVLWMKIALSFSCLNSATFEGKFLDLNSSLNNKVLRNKGSNHFEKWLQLRWKNFKTSSKRFKKAKFISPDKITDIMTKMSSYQIKSQYFIQK